MTRPFTCRGFAGTAQSVNLTGRVIWNVEVIVGGVSFRAVDTSLRAAKERVRRKLDAVERAFRERGKR